jgi:hypothetical protein
MKKIFLTAFLVMLPGFASAATLRFDPLVRDTVPGDVFIATMRIDVSPGECVNAATVGITYPTNLLTLNAVSRGESIFSLWISEVADKEKGEIHFVAGIPGGYCGRAVGDPGQSNVVAKIVFQYKGLSAADSASIGFLPDTEVDLNDGMGTKADLVTLPLSVQYATSSSSHNEWLSVVSQDIYPPEEFVPQIFTDTGGKKTLFYLMFDATDKQSGIEHYEVLEEDPYSFGFRFGSHIKAKPAPVTSPYLLQDQTLSSRIVVRAYDHAGNMQEAIIPPKNYRSPFSLFSVSDYLVPLLLIIACIVAVFMSFYHYRKPHDEQTDELESEEHDVP